jgi:sugar lactone lactonase YvrE
MAHERIPRKGENMRRLTIFLLVIGLLVAIGAIATAQDETDSQEGMTPVAEGLTYPRDMFVAEDGTLYIASPGTGGQVMAIGKRGEGQLGGTAQVVAIAPDGTQTIPVTGFPSFFVQGEATGLSDVHIANGLMWIALGGGPNIEPGTPANPFFSLVVAVDPATGRIVEFIDLYAYEAENNPAGDTVEGGDAPLLESNPVSLDFGPDGTLYISDPATNTVFTWTSEDGLQVFATYPEDPVPTGVSVGPDGNVFIGFLTSFPFPSGTAFVEERSPDGELINIYEGLTTVVDVLATEDGVYAVSFSTFDAEAEGLPWAPNSGYVIELNSMETLAEGLNFPYGIAMDNDGNLLVSINSAYVEPGTGAVMQLDMSMMQDG